MPPLPSRRESDHGTTPMLRLVAHSALKCYAHGRLGLEVSQDGRVTDRFVPAQGYVRAARPADAEAIGRIQVRSWLSNCGGLLPVTTLRALRDPAAPADVADRWRSAI